MDIDNVCRLCLAKDANFHIFHENANTVPIRLMTLTAIEVQNNDGLPQLICSNCRLRLEEFYHFRKRCHAAERQLHRLKHRKGQAVAGELTTNATDIEEDQDLQDVDYSLIVCEESAANWRMKAAHLIRTELDVYKRELANICKVELRREIEQEVRNEVEQLLIEEARKQCRLSTLDDLFCEVERFFIRKRNEAMQEQINRSEGFGSGSETIEHENVSTIVSQEQTTDAQNLEANEIANTSIGDVSVVELMDNEGIEVVNLKSELSNTNASELNLQHEETDQPASVPMVEINMRDSELNHLLDELSSANFLAKTHKPSAENKNKKKKDRRVSFAREIFSPTFNKKREQKCRKHVCRPPARRHSEIDDGANCIRCRLRGGQDLPDSAS